MRLPKAKNFKIRITATKIWLIVRIEKFNETFYVERNITKERRIEIEEIYEKNFKKHVNNSIDEVLDKIISWASMNAPIINIEHDFEYPESIETMHKSSKIRSAYLYMLKETPAFPYRLRIKFRTDEGRKLFLDKYKAHHDITESD